MSKHTKEPWAFEEDERTFRIRGGNGRTVVGISKQYMDDIHLTMSDMRRIVACVNELAGKPEGYVKQLEQQRDELLEAAKLVIQYGNLKGRVLVELSKAIKNAEGGK